MIGFRKKPGNKEHQKKKWEEELEDPQNENGSMTIEIDKAELAKLAKSDDEENDEKMIPEENKEEEGTLGITFKEKPDKEEEEQEDENEKSLAWMSSEDEAIAKEVVEDEAKEDNEGNQEASKKEADRDMRTVFASNLPVKAEDEEIKKFFAQYGYVVEIDVPRNEGAKVNKGRAFIEYATIEDAAKALEANGVKFEGSVLNVTQGLNNATMNLASSKEKQPVMMTFANVILEGGRVNQTEEEENEIQMEKVDEDDDDEEEEEEGEGDEDESGEDSDKGDKSDGSESDSDDEDNSKRKKDKGRKSRDEADDAAEFGPKKRERSRSQEKKLEKAHTNPRIQEEQHLEARYAKMPGKKLR